MEAKKKYPSPDKHPEFKKYWDAYIESIASRDNFGQGHLYQLEELCQLHKEKLHLMDVIEAGGYTRTSFGKSNANVDKLVEKSRPEFGILDRVRKQILDHTERLDLLPSKGKGTRGKGKNADWD